MDARGDKAPVREATIQKAILRWLRTRPRSFTVKLAAGPYSVPGLPDVLHLEGGQAYFSRSRPRGAGRRPYRWLPWSSWRRPGRWWPSFGM